MLDIPGLKKAMENPGWKGPEVMYFVAHEDIDGVTEEDPCYLMEITPDPKWSFQVWQSAFYVRFNELWNDRYFTIREIPHVDFVTQVAFNTMPLHKVNAEDMDGFD